LVTFSKTQNLDRLHQLLDALTTELKFYLPYFMRPLAAFFLSVKVVADYLQASAKTKMACGLL